MLNFEELVALFNEQSQTVKTNLTGILSLIKDGKIPTESAISDLDTSFVILNERYEAVYSFAKSEMNEEELPPLGSSMHSNKIS